MAHNEKTLSQELVFDGRIFKVVRKTVELENGDKAFREVVIHTGGAAILPIDRDNNLWLIRQFRSPFEQEILEIPAGKIEIGEKPFEAAKRELGEETGCTAKDYFDIGDFWPTVGYCGEKIYLFIATGITPGEQHLDKNEFVSVVKVPFSEALAMVLDGRIKDGKTIIAIFKAKEILGL